MKGKWKNLALATVMFNLGFTIWFSFAPYTEGIAEEFGLSVAELGHVASAAIVTDKYGAPVTACGTMLVVGAAAIVSAFAQSYTVFIASRIVASLAGITFVIGIQHVAEWFDEEYLGTAEGIYAGIGNAGAGIGSLLVLPALFGAGYSGPIFSTNWRAAFFYTGVAAIVVGIAQTVALRLDAVRCGRALRGVHHDVRAGVRYEQLARDVLPGGRGVQRGAAPGRRPLRGDLLDRRRAVATARRVYQ